ncbi:MAG: TRAP transporter small permease subunit, partial [Gammaproteobacteria bacterium]
MEWLVRLSDLLDRWITWIGRAAAWTSLALIAVILFDVVTRRFLVLGSTKLQELEWHIHAVLFMFCLGFAYLKDAHVRIDLVRERLSQRTQWWIELLGCLLFLIPYCCVILYFGVDWWHRSFEMNEASDSATGLPYRWIIKIALPLGFTLLLLATLVVLARKFIELFGPRELRSRVSQIEEEEFEHLDDVKVDEVKLD